jgi:dipeptidyl aminopeptidase/acylaminoacyl peptidase
MLKEPQTSDNAPWKQRYRLPRVYARQIAAHAPTHGLANSNTSGVNQLYAWNVLTGNLTQLTNRPEGVSYGIISPDGKHVYFHDDKKGDEVGHIVRIPFTGGPLEDITSDFPLYETTGFGFSRAGNTFAMTTITSEGFDVYTALVTAETTIGSFLKIAHYDSLTSEPVLSSNGEVAVVTITRSLDSLDYSLISFNTKNGNTINRLSDANASIEYSVFSPVQDDMRVAVTTDRSGVKRPLLWNAQTSELTDIALPELEGEVEPLDWSPDGKLLLLCQFVQAVQHLYIYNLSSKTLIPLQHPQGTFTSVYFTPEGSIFAQVASSTHPTQLIELDIQTGEERRIVLPAETTATNRQWTSISFASANGDNVQAWLATPEGTGPFPTILEMHGGPEAVTTESFSPSSQCWLDHGFAFLSINYHGSTTFGRNFQEKIRGHIGHWELLDMVAARDWLVQHNIAIPNQIFLTGWSYGGYLTLYGLGRRPDLWAGGLAGVAFADYVIAYEDEAEMLKAYDRGLMGGTPQEKPEEYKTSSPITYAEHVQAPILIIQGHNDRRCPPRSVQVYEQRLQQLGKPIEVFWFDAGHGSLNVEQQIDHQERMLRFAYQTLTQQSK